MKSKRVKEFIEGHIKLRLLSFTAADIDYCATIAEEDMAEKAAKAFCFCKCGVGPCIMKQVGREECKDLREFKRKMEE